MHLNSQHFVVGTAADGEGGRGEGVPAVALRVSSPSPTGPSHEEDGGFDIPQFGIQQRINRIF